MRCSTRRSLQHYSCLFTNCRYVHFKLQSFCKSMQSQISLQDNVNGIMNSSCEDPILTIPGITPLVLWKFMIICQIVHSYIISFCLLTVVGYVSTLQVTCFQHQFMECVMFQGDVSTCKAIRRADKNKHSESTYILSRFEKSISSHKQLGYNHYKIQHSIFTHNE